MNGDNVDKLAMWARELLKAVVWHVLPHGLRRQVRRHHSHRLLADDRVREPEFAVLGLFVKPGACVVDIGANIGLYTKTLARLVGPTGRVYGIEPIPDTFDLLTWNVTRLRLGNVVAMLCAVSDTDGERTRLVVPRVGPFGLENPYRARIERGPVRGRQVIAETCTLDRLFADGPGHVSFLKCDVEGHELACLRGAVNLIRLSRPTWLIEASGDPRRADSSAGSVLSFMRKFGYQAHVVDGSKLRLWRPDEGARGNYFFVPEVE